MRVFYQYQASQRHSVLLETNVIWKDSIYLINSIVDTLNDFNFLYRINTHTLPQCRSSFIEYSYYTNLINTYLKCWFEEQLQRKWKKCAFFLGEINFHFIKKTITMLNRKAKLSSTYGSDIRLWHTSTNKYWWYQRPNENERNTRVMNNQLLCLVLIDPAGRLSCWPGGFLY